MVAILGYEFQRSKCKVMHFGRNNHREEYYINDVQLKVVNEEKDLGIIVKDDLKVASQCAAAVKASNRTLGMIKRTFSTRNKTVMIKLYKSLVRPHLEYCMSVWRPHYQKDIELLERVQRRALGLIEGFKDLRYEERLLRCNLTTLKVRRLRGDLIETFKLI